MDPDQELLDDLGNQLVDDLGNPLVTGAVIVVSGDNPPASLGVPKIVIIEDDNGDLGVLNYMPRVFFIPPPPPGPAARAPFKVQQQIYYWQDWQPVR